MNRAVTVLPLILVGWPDAESYLTSVRVNTYGCYDCAAANGRKWTMSREQMDRLLPPTWTEYLEVRRLLQFRQPLRAAA